uniref:Elongation factor P C-terminal domain-containing protein n=1 Tax=Fagus sylvatica TaxID=28930 RepID=A0A2N9HVH9_FAGSY
MLGEMRVTIRLYDDIPLSASVPKRVTCIVKEAHDPMKGIPTPPKDKKVVLENGLILEVPLFVVAGDAVVINTETDSYCDKLDLRRTLKVGVSRATSSVKRHASPLTPPLPATTELIAGAAAHHPRLVIPARSARSTARSSSLNHQAPGAVFGIPTRTEAPPLTPPLPATTEQIAGAAAHHPRVVIPARSARSTARSSSAAAITTCPRSGRRNHRNPVPEAGGGAGRVGALAPADMDGTRKNLSYPNTRNVFRSFREGNKVFVVQKQQNGRGSFVTITVLGDSKGRGGVIIPAGKESWGWRRLSEELDGLLNPKVAANHGEIHRQPPAVKLTRDQDGSWKASWAGLDDSANGPNQAPKLGPILAPKSVPKPGPHPGQIHKVWKPIGPKPNELATDPKAGIGSGSFRPTISTQMSELQVANRFSVFQIGESSGDCDPPETETRPISVTCTAASPQAEPSVPSGSELAKGVNDGTIITQDSETCTAASPQAEPSVPSGSELANEGTIITHDSVVPGSEPTEVDRTWGSSSEWVLELRDGRRVTIPLSLVRQPVVSGPIPSALFPAGSLVIPGVSVGVGSTIDDLSSVGDTECTGEDEEDDENISLVWEDSEVEGTGTAMVCWEDDTGILEVEPLAMSKPVETGVSEGTSVIQEHGDVVPPSDWVLGKSKRIGKVLGASYHGNEERINRLLMEIDGRRPQPSREILPHAEERVGKGFQSYPNEFENRFVERSWETKLEFIDRGIIRSLWGIQHVDWLYLGSDGASGGILIMWDRRVVAMTDSAVGHFSISCKFRNVLDQKEWAFSGVYGPNINRERNTMWEELAGVVTWWGVPWVVGGDFNAIRFPSERLGASHFTSSMHAFSDFITSCRLRDLPLEGGLFTWSNNRENAVMSRIDRFLLSEDWDGFFPMILQKRLPRILSDHFPIILECGDFSRGRRPFRFENMWLKADGFKERVKEWWDSYIFFGTPSYIMASLDAVAETRHLTREESNKRVQLVVDLERTSLLDEISWRQKSRALWLREGDKNTKFFHRLANSNRRYNSISSLSINGVMSTDPDAISESITNFYSHLFEEEESDRPLLDGLDFSMIPAEDAIWLERPLRRKCCWDILRPDVMAFLHYFHDLCSFEKSLNATFVSLIPKKTEAMGEVKDFRPISLVGGSYKILAKLLAPLSIGEQELGIGDGRLCWRNRATKGFTVKDYYVCLCPPLVASFPWKIIWKAKVPPRIAFFSWTAALGKILTIDNLRKRHLIIIDRCCLCKLNGESVDHLLLHCPLARELWSMVFGLFGLDWVMPCKVIQLWAAWQIRSADLRNMAIWRMVPHCVIWCLWRERNARLFEDCESSMVDIKLLFFQTLYAWVNSVGVSSINSITELIDHCCF